MMWMIPVLIGVALAAPPPVQRQYADKTHHSIVFGENRTYRIFLPAGYEKDRARRYPAIYYFHGHSDRYTLEKYDGGKDTVPKIEQFVANHPVIVVAVDGYDAKTYEGFYGGAPWDIFEDGGRMDFGLYWRELVSHIDATYRTQTSRRFRATSGLSMGGFMSLYLSARFPDLAASASAFNPGPEFFAGEPGRRILWRPKDHVETHAFSMVRLIRASGDYISQYHEETRQAYAKSERVRFEYRVDEYHRHWATSIEETFDFHMSAFADPQLDRAPERWNYTCAYRDCEAWDYRIQTNNPAPGYIDLQEVTANSLRIATRQWAPDGPPRTDQSITLSTAPRYQPNALYKTRDIGATSEVRADPSGRLTFTLNGGLHQLSLEGPGLEPVTAPVILPVSALHLMPDKNQPLPLTIHNSGATPIEGLQVQLTTEYPTADVDGAGAIAARIEPGQTITVSPQVRFTAADGEFQRVHLVASCRTPVCLPRGFDVFVAPADTATPWQVEILDGRTITLPVFRQKGNQGGGGAVERTITEGRGNGNGILEPGEQGTIWVRLRQGLDPFDKGNWHRTKVYTGASPWLHEVADITEEKQREWTGARERTSLIELRADAPPGVEIPVLLENESWSFHFTPDVRYGKEPLYQAFQRHRKHVHMLTLGAKQP